MDKIPEYIEILDFLLDPRSRDLEVILDQVSRN